MDRFPEAKTSNEFSNQISKYALLVIQPTILCVYGVDSFILHVPGLEHLNTKRFHSLFSDEGTFGGIPGGFVSELKLRSTSFAGRNFPDKINLDYFKNEAKSGNMADFDNSSKILRRESGPKYILLLA